MRFYEKIFLSLSAKLEGGLYVTAARASFFLLPPSPLKIYEKTKESQEDEECSGISAKLDHRRPVSVVPSW